MGATSLFVAHTVGSVAGVFCFAVGLEDECFEAGFHFRFMILLVFSRWFRQEILDEIQGGLALGFVSFSFFVVVIFCFIRLFFR